MINRLFRLFAYLIGYPLFSLVLKIKVEGESNLPSASEPLIIICNHFSWFEVPLLVGKLPDQIIFIGSEEVWAHPLGRRLANAFGAIPIQRGRPERQALKQSLQVLQSGYSLGIFPEGGIDPELRPLTAAGIDVSGVQGQTSRFPPELIEARPGAAYLALKSGVRLLPTAVIGGEYVMSNLRRGRRTPVTLVLGRPFGPLQIEPGLRGRARRQALDELGTEMMCHIGALLPETQRGVYRDRC